MFPRVGIPHIFNFQLSDGPLRTICGKNMIKENTLTTMSGDSVFPGICPVCTHQFDEMYKDDLKDNPRIARNSWQSRMERLRSHHYNEILGPAGLTYEMINRSWTKLARAKRTLNRNKKK